MAFCRRETKCIGSHITLMATENTTTTAERSLADNVKSI